LVSWKPTFIQTFEGRFVKAVTGIALIERLCDAKVSPLSDGEGFKKARSSYGNERNAWESARGMAWLFVCTIDRFQTQ
jgi:hypothetical protein